MDGGLEGMVKNNSTKERLMAQFGDLVVLANAGMMKVATAANNELKTLIGDKTVYDRPVYEIKETVFAAHEDRPETPISLRGKNAVFIYGGYMHPNHFMQRLVLMNGAICNQAQSLLLIAPYIPFGRQDIVDPEWSVCSFDHVARQIDDSMEYIEGSKKMVLTFDLHARQEAIYFGKCLNLFAGKVLADYVRNNVDYDPKNACVVAPDGGADKRTEDMAKRLGLPTIPMGKTRYSTNAAMPSFIGATPEQMQGKDALFCDDIGCTVGTLRGSGLEANVRQVRKKIALLTHGVWSSKDGISAYERLFHPYSREFDVPKEKSKETKKEQENRQRLEKLFDDFPYLEGSTAFDVVIQTDSIPRDNLVEEWLPRGPPIDDFRLHPRIQVASLAPVIAQLMYNKFTNNTLTGVLTHKPQS